MLSFDIEDSLLSHMKDEDMCRSPSPSTLPPPSALVTPDKHYATVSLGEDEHSFMMMDESVGSSSSTSSVSDAENFQLRLEQFLQCARESDVSRSWLKKHLPKQLPDAMDEEDVNSFHTDSCQESMERRQELLESFTSS